MDKNTTLPATQLLTSRKSKNGVVRKISLREHLEMYRKFFFEKGEKIPVAPLPQLPVRLSNFLQPSENCLKAIWLGHSSLLINIEGYTILTDPVFSTKVSPVGPYRFNKQLPLQIEDLSYVDMVLISHDHYDHLNKYSIKKLAHRTGKFLVPTGVGKILRSWGVKKEQIEEFVWWQEYAINQKLTLAFTPTQHFSGRSLFDRNKALWGSWVMRTPDKSVYFSGDSGYFSGFKEIGEKYGPFDVVFLECGAYNENWSQVHMFPEQTVQASLDLGSTILQPIHWATFNLSLHSWYEPVERLVHTSKKVGTNISIPKIGEIVDYTKQNPLDFWWIPSMHQSQERSRSSAPIHATQ